MLSAQCQSDEDWHAGKLSFIFNVSAWEQGFSTPASFFPLSPPSLQKAGHYSYSQTASQARVREREIGRERETERESEGGRKKKKERARD